MFTGIVQEIGTVLAVTRSRVADHVRIYAPKTAQGLVVGESVAIHGACLSVVRLDREALTFEIIPETRRLTTLGTLSAGQRVNVERSLSLSDRLNGHLVLGHIDGVGRIRRVTRAGGEVALELALPSALRRYLVSKGPVAVDGVSLTVGSRLSSNAFSVFLIPETLRKTTLGHCKAGDRVNIEVDYFAKLVTQFVSAV